MWCATSIGKHKMTTQNEISALYELDDQARKVLRNLRQVMLDSKELGCTLADDADDLYIRLRVVLGAIGEHAFKEDQLA